MTQRLVGCGWDGMGWDGMGSIHHLAGRFPEPVYVMHCSGGHDLRHKRDYAGWRLVSMDVGLLRSLDPGEQGAAAASQPRYRQEEPSRTNDPSSHPSWLSCGVRRTANGAISFGFGTGDRIKTQKLIAQESRGDVE